MWFLQIAQALLFTSINTGKNHKLSTSKLNNFEEIKSFEIMNIQII